MTNRTPCRCGCDTDDTTVKISHAGRCSPGCTCGRHADGHCLLGCQCGRHGDELAPSYEAVHDRARHRLQETSCLLIDNTCSSGRLQVAWLWHSTPWEFVRMTPRNATAARWWSVREGDYALMCGRHHKLYDRGDFFLALLIRDGEKAA